MKKKICTSTGNSVLTFGTFDFFHPGHEYFLRTAATYGERLITIIARDENVVALKGYMPIFSQEERKKQVKVSGIPDEVFIGSKNAPMSWLLKFRPKVICLGYDQQGFSSLLSDFIKENNLNTAIVRLKPYKKTLYKSSILRKEYLLRKEKEEK